MKVSDIAEKLVQIIPKTFYLFCTKQVNKKFDNVFSFNIDNMLQYQPLHNDFGPLKISCVFQYVDQLNGLELMNKNNIKQCWHITSINPKKYTNSIFLVCAFLVISLGRTPQQAFQPFRNFKILGFRDASFGQNNFQIQILDCLKGLKKVLALQWFDMKKFSLKTYEYYEKTQNGDINEIIKNKFYAFHSLIDTDKNSPEKISKKVDLITSALKKIGINLVIQLSQDQIFTNALKSANIQSFNVNFSNGLTPDIKEIDQFFEIIQNYGQGLKIGLTCETGLGKTGTIIGCYMIKKYGFTAREAISWIRLCRPGSVAGPQQQFLVQYQKQNSKKIVESPELQKLQKSPTRIQRRHSMKQKTSDKSFQSGDLKNSLKIEKIEKAINQKLGISSPLDSPNIRPSSKKKEGFDVNRFISSLKSK